MGYTEIQFAVACDATKESSYVLDELSKAQVDVYHVNSSSKNAADKKLKVLMRRFVHLHGINSRIILISGDGDFTDDIFDIKTHREVKILLIYPHKTSDALKQFAHESMSYNDLVADLRADVQTHLKVTNLPSAIEDRNQNLNSCQVLSSRVETFNGRTISFDPENGTAILSFDNSDDARGFRDLNANTVIGSRKIFVQNYQWRRVKSPIWRSGGGDRQPRVQSVNRYTQSRIRRFSSNESICKNQINTEINIEGTDEWKTMCSNPNKERKTSGTRETSFEYKRSCSVSAIDTFTGDLEAEPSLNLSLRSRVYRRLNASSRQPDPLHEDAGVKYQIMTLEKYEPKVLEYIYRSVGVFRVERSTTPVFVILKLSFPTIDQAVILKDKFDKAFGDQRDNNSGSLMVKYECCDFLKERTVRVISILHFLKQKDFHRPIREIYLDRYNEDISNSEIREIVRRYRTQLPPPEPEAQHTSLKSVRGLCTDFLERSLQGYMTFEDFNNMYLCCNPLDKNYAEFHQLQENVLNETDPGICLIQDTMGDIVVLKRGRLVQKFLYQAHVVASHHILFTDQHCRRIPMQTFYLNFQTMFPGERFFRSLPSIPNSLMGFDGVEVTLQPIFALCNHVLRVRGDTCAPLDVSRLDTDIGGVSSFIEKNILCTDTASVFDKMDYFFYLFNDRQCIGSFKCSPDMELFNDLYAVKNSLMLSLDWSPPDWDLVDRLVLGGVTSSPGPKLAVPGSYQYYLETSGDPSDKFMVAPPPPDLIGDVVEKPTNRKPSPDNKGNQGPLYSWKHEGWSLVSPRSCGSSAGQNTVPGAGTNGFRGFALPNPPARFGVNSYLTGCLARTSRSVNRTPVGGILEDLNEEDYRGRLNEDDVFVESSESGTSDLVPAEELEIFSEEGGCILNVPQGSIEELGLLSRQEGSIFTVAQDSWRESSLKEWRVLTPQSCSLKEWRVLTPQSSGKQHLEKSTKIVISPLLKVSSSQSTEESEESSNEASKRAEESLLGASNRSRRRRSKIAANFSMGNIK